MITMRVKYKDGRMVNYRYGDLIKAATDAEILLKDDEVDSVYMKQEGDNESRTTNE